MTAALLEADRLALQRLYLDDGPAFCREILPHWFPSPMPWVHRGVWAILAKQTHFLLKFGPEKWDESLHIWSPDELARIVRLFTYPIRPSDPESPTRPVFVMRNPEGKPIHYTDVPWRTVDESWSIDLHIGRFVNVMLPRGVSKTTLTNAWLLRDGCLYGIIPFFAYVSESAEGHAEPQLENIKRELMQNDRIHAIWGNLVPNRTHPNSWTSDAIECLNGVLAVAKGRGSQIRGLNKFARRPSVIVLDDIEDDESVKTEEHRTKTRKWRTSVVEQALPQIGQKGRLVYLGTPKHPDDSYMENAKDPRYTTIRFGVLDPEGTPLWEHYMNKEQIEAKRLSFARLGQLYEYGLEFLCRSDTTAKFKFQPKHYNRYRQYTPEEFCAKFPMRALSIDPAISEDPTACFCALGVVGMSDFGFFHAAALHLERGMSPRDQVDMYFFLSKYWHCNRHGVETVAYQKALKFLLQEDMMRQEHWFSIEEQNVPKGGPRPQAKHIRVEGILQPRMAAELFTFQERWPDLINQFVDWGHGAKDGPDVLAQCVALCAPGAGLALKAGNDNDSTPAILREVTMPPIDDLDYAAMGVP